MNQLAGQSGHLRTQIIRPVEVIGFDDSYTMTIELRLDNGFSAEDSYELYHMVNFLCGTHKMEGSP